MQISFAIGLFILINSFQLSGNVVSSTSTSAVASFAAYKPLPFESNIPEKDESLIYTGKFKKPYILIKKKVYVINGPYVV